MIRNIKNILGRIRNLLFFYTGKAKNIYITEKMLWLYCWRKPIKPYAFIRVHNEIATIDTCMKSILPAVKGGVIGFHHSDEEDDGTRDYVLAFCKKYPQFTPVEYPHKVIGAGDKEYRNPNIDPHRKLDAYYNFIWDKLPKNEWIIKIDCDHIYNAKYVKDLCRLPFNEDECVFLSRLNLKVIDDEVYLIKGQELVEPGDSWILYNGDLIPKSPFGFYLEDNEDVYRAREKFSHNIKNHKRIFSILSNWHFPYIKKRRQDLMIDFNALEISKLYKIGGVNMKGDCQMI